MAGDWIKMRVDLQTHPKIVRILSATKADKFRVIGGLHAVWSVFDTHSVDGTLNGYTPDTLDHIIGWPGFSEAMIRAEWLSFDGAETLVLPEFDEHNGKSGKRRAEDQKRKRDGRKCPQNVQNESGQNADENRTREEKRREEIKDTPISPSGDSSASSILEQYHAKLPNCQRIAVLNDKRKKRLVAAEKLAKKICADQGWKYDSPVFWGAFFGECASDAWMRGDVPNPNNPAWKQNIDVLLAEDRIASVMDKAIATMRGAQ